MGDLLNELSTWYINQQLDFDKVLVHLRYKTIKKFFRGSSCLELGSAAGEMTQYLVKNFDQLTVVEGSSALLQQVPDYPNIAKINSLFEDYLPKEKFDTIVMEHILEHVDDPIILLKRVKNWVKEDGVILIGVPNADSIHRLAAVKMGLLQQKTSLNDRDRQVGHQRVYTQSALFADIHKAGLQVIENGGVFFKPLSNGQIDQHWTPQMIEGFYLMGFDFPEHCAELFAVASL